MTESQTCPRRMSEFGPWKRDEGLDEWRTGRAGLIGQEKVGLSCSFCGSLHPDRFMELAREGWVVTPTDKGYKAYIGKPLTDDEIASRKTRWLQGEIGVSASIRRLGEQDGKTAEQIAADIEAEWEAVELPRQRDSTSQRAKFYYKHLSPEQRTEFIELVNAKKMRIAYPGYFYQLPFFAKHAEVTA